MSLGMYESLWLFGFFHLFHTLRAESPSIFLDKSEGEHFEISQDHLEFFLLEINVLIYLGINNKLFFCFLGVSTHDPSDQMLSCQIIADCVTVT